MTYIRILKKMLKMRNKWIKKGLNMIGCLLIDKN